ncbi:hypothetical protein WJX82_007473 [Trebouxia sp. C0006]
MASPELTKEQKSAIETAIESAKETCESGSAGACATAWDEVEELSASAADKKQAKSTSDPLDQYCDDNPEADECSLRGLRSNFSQEMQQLQGTLNNATGIHNNAGTYGNAAQ